MQKIKPAGVRRLGIVAGAELLGGVLIRGVQQERRAGFHGLSVALSNTVDQRENRWREIE